ncbi:hypothetical protein E2C01_009242 [Portunus trituberculatus]|uniref:Uncharacterized protein n=1 Tax=Portunus trituberculatus TaxID=210409 RepID=A0A5B7D4C5_PORTR|nr:hypothetical protein [Portunus trituberculatus]
MGLDSTHTTLLNMTRVHLLYSDLNDAVSPGGSAMRGVTPDTRTPVAHEPVLQGSLPTLTGHTPPLHIC